MPERTRRLLERVAALAFASRAGDPGDRARKFAEAIAQGRWNEAEQAFDDPEPEGVDSTRGRLTRPMRPTRAEPAIAGRSADPTGATDTASTGPAAIGPAATGDANRDAIGEAISDAIGVGAVEGAAVAAAVQPPIDARRSPAGGARGSPSVVEQARAQLHDQHHRATGLAQRVNQLEVEMQRLAGEVTTDPLTQVANRRGLLHAFEIERGRFVCDGRCMTIGLLDIDNFKRLNDDLGHGAGDAALKALAARIGQILRPGDHVARYGGEEFVVLFPDTHGAEAEQILARLQGSLSSGLFSHAHSPVVVTFSAGLTAYRAGESIEAALERADQALYEAKGAGKNRTCFA